MLVECLVIVWCLLDECWVGEFWMMVGSVLGEFLGDC